MKIKNCRYQVTLVRFWYWDHLLGLLFGCLLWIVKETVRWVFLLLTDGYFLLSTQVTTDPIHTACSHDILNFSNFFCLILKNRYFYPSFSLHFEITKPKTCSLNVMESVLKCSDWKKENMVIANRYLGLVILLFPPK